MSETATKLVTGQAQHLKKVITALAMLAIASLALAVLCAAILLVEGLDPMAISACALSTGITLFAALALIRARNVVKDVTEAEQKAFELAGHDALSGLPNRRVFKERLEQAMSRMKRDQSGIAVLFLDLDKFKEVNDTFGHAGGDFLIKQFGNRMTDLLRGADTLARLGGDEFAIIQTDVRDLSDVEALARRILDATKESFALNGGMAFVGVSIGIALAPEHGDDADLLMKLADLSLYQAKNDGRNRYSVFARQLGDQLRLRKVVEDELRQTIENDGLSIAYQPQVEADTGSISGFEALVRWSHAKLGNVPPSEFIPIAESTGLINALGEWVLRRACLDALRWPSHYTVAVNVSPIQFKHKNFVETVARIITETGIEAHRIELELTEGVVVEDADQAEAAIMELRALGVQFALDDFGTGYSSLIYLRRFAFDKIKIDRTFLDSLESTGESTILVHSVVHLGRALGLTVVAEGVETAEQRRVLQSIGCHMLQGYYFGRPVSQAQTLSLIDKAQRNEGRIAA
jgi:diguanylate cyclase